MPFCVKLWQNNWVVYNKWRFPRLEEIAEKARKENLEKLGSFVVSSGTHAIYVNQSPYTFASSNVQER